LVTPTIPQTVAFPTATTLPFTWARRLVWEGYPPTKCWQSRRTYGVTQVLNYADVTLALPVVLRDETHVLYQIPP